MFIHRILSGGLLFAMIAAIGCGGGSSETPPTASIEPPPAADAKTSPPASSELSTVPLIPGVQETEPAAPQIEKFPEVTFVTSAGEIRVRLDAESAPETVDNFLYNYVDRDFYNGTIFHYVQDGFIAIAGGYDADLNAKTPKPPIRNEAANGKKNVRGTIAMSRLPEYADSATSQFYFNLADNPTLDPTDTDTDKDSGETFGYCVFGEVVDGMEVVDKIAKVEVRDAGDFAKVPVQPIVIESVRRDK